MSLFSSQEWTVLTHMPDRCTCPPWLCASCSFWSFHRGLDARVIWMLLHCCCLVAIRSLPLNVMGFFSLLLFKSASVLHKEFFQYLIEHQWCSSDDDFRKMYWVGSFYLLIINIESYQEVISSGIWITVACLVLTSFQGTVWGHSRDGLEKFWPRITQLLTLSCNSPLCCSLLWMRRVKETPGALHELSPWN